MPRRPPPSSCRGNLVLATLLAITLLFFCSTDAQGRPGGPHDRRREEQQQRWSDENAPRVLAASDDAAAAPSPSAPPTLALLLAPTPAPSRVAAAAVAASESLLLREGGVKGAAAAAPSPSAISDGDDDGDDDDNEEEEEASSGDGAGQEAAGSEEEADPEAQAGVAADVASAASEPPAAPVQPKRVRFLARGASKAIDQSEVDPSSLSGEKGSFVFYGRYCGPGWTDKQNRPGIDPVDEACHAHDTCYGQAREANPPSHKVRRAAAECACDRALVSALKDFKKNKQQQAAASKAAKRAAGDMEKLFDVKCPLAVAGAVLRPPSPSPESAPGGNW